MASDQRRRAGERLLAEMTAAGKLNHTLTRTLMRTIRRRTLTRTLSVVAALQLFATAAAAQVTAIRAGRLLDPETGTIATNQVILVENGKFTVAK